MNRHEIKERRNLLKVQIDGMIEEHNHLSDLLNRYERREHAGERYLRRVAVSTAILITDIVLATILIGSL